MSECRVNRFRERMNSRSYFEMNNFIRQGTILKISLQMNGPDSLFEFQPTEYPFLRTNYQYKESDAKRPKLNPVAIKTDRFYMKTGKIIK